ncbi:MAG TPA: DUF1330 domain-containing protein [Bacteroidetes bacterium]|nr:DUF1330 domain-containing protein [Bacteroidota bacterium]
MQLTQVIPAPEQMFQLMSYPKNTPLVMVNVIKFKEKTAETGESGAAAFARYFKNMTPFVEKVGAKLLWKGKVASTVVGDSVDQPHLIFMVEYPSVDHFFSMLANPDYKEIAQDRTVALEYGGMFACATEE